MGALLRGVAAASRRSTPRDGSEHVHDVLSGVDHPLVHLVQPRLESSACGGVLQRVAFGIGDRRAGALLRLLTGEHEAGQRLDLTGLIEVDARLHMELVELADLFERALHPALELVSDRIRIDGDESARLLPDELRPPDAHRRGDDGRGQVLARDSYETNDPGCDVGSPVTLPLALPLFPGAEPEPDGRGRSEPADHVSNRG